MILSASRRTDIPAFYSEWFMNRLKAGYVLTRNPMNYSQVSKINLSCDMIDCIVFWTKDPQNMLKHLPDIDTMGYKYYFQFTLTPYDSILEKNLRSKDKIIDTFIQLSETIGKNKLIWRYDPIILNKDIGIDFHINNFEHMCEKLHKYTNVIHISFVDLYAKLRTPLIRKITEDEMIRIAGNFSKIAAKYNLSIKSCCENVVLMKPYGIESASCVDREKIEEICGYNIKMRYDKNQREGCNCVQSVDIGAYNTCRNACVYCYANYSEVSTADNCRRHNPFGELLIGEISERDKITERKN